MNGGPTSNEFEIEFEIMISIWTRLSRVQLIWVGFDSDPQKMQLQRDLSVRQYKLLKPRKTRRFIECDAKATIIDAQKAGKAILRKAS